MAEERNALAELAEELSKDSKIIFGCGGGGPMATVISARQEKASQIISELAKVQFLKNLDGEKISHPGDACHAVDICRAIAEEGGAE